MIEGPDVIDSETRDPRKILEGAQMSRPQILGVAITALLMAVDGFDLLATAFIAPSLAEAFGVGPAGLGILLSAVLTGTLFGAFLLAPLADRIGRRPVVLISLLLMTTGMLASAAAGSIFQLAALRLVTGIGVGAMMVVVNPLAAELANGRSRSFVVAIKSIGFPIGGAGGGWLASVLLAEFGWRSVFLLGGVMGLALLPLTLWLLPESVAWLVDRQPRRALARVNALMVRFGHAAVQALPPVAPSPKSFYREIFGGRYRTTTLSASAAHFLTLLAIFFFLSWQVGMLVQAGVTPEHAAGIAGVSSLAGAISVLVFAIATRRYDARRVSGLSVVGLGVAMGAFGLSPASAWPLTILAMTIGVFITAATVALYVVTTAAFEGRMLATGSGFVIGVGRIGSAAGPGLAGFLFAEGLDRAAVSILMGGCAILAGGVMIWLLKTPEVDA